MRGKNKIYTGLLLLLFPLFLLQQTRPIDSLQRLLKASKPDTVKAFLLNELSEKFFDEKIKKSIEFASQALELSEQLNYTNGIWQAHFNLGYARFYDGNNREAFLHLAEAEKILSGIKDPENLARVVNACGLVYSTEGNYVMAISKYRQALKTYEQTRNHAGMASLLLNIGVEFHDQKMYRQAVPYLQKAIDNYRLTNRRSGLANAYTRLGNTYNSLEKNDTALAHYKTAMEIFSSINHKRGMAIVMNNIAGIFQDQKNNDEALPLYMKALAIRDSIGDKAGIAILCLNIGTIHSARKDPGPALQYLERAYRLSAEGNDAEMKKECLNELASLHAATGNFELAWKMQRQYTRLNDSLYTAENTRQFHEMNTRYETEKKEKELQQKEMEARQKGFQRNIFLAGLIIMAVLSFFMIRSYFIIKKAKSELQKQKGIIEEKNKAVMDSIHYAKRIQTALITSERYIDRSLRGLTGKK